MMVSGLRVRGLAAEEEELEDEVTWLSVSIQRGLQRFESRQALAPCAIHEGMIVRPRVETDQIGGMR